MTSLRVRPFRQTRQLYFVGVLACFCLLGFAPVGYGQTEQVSQLIGQLEDKDATTQGDAANALVAIGSSAVEPLIAALKAPDANVRVHALWVLSRIKDPHSIDPVIPFLKDPDADVRVYAAIALGINQDMRVVEPLIGALKDSDADVRAHAAWALALNKDARAVEPLIGALKDSDVDVRINAVRAFMLIKDPGATEPLIGALSDADAKVRLNAAIALGQIKDPRAVEPLIACLKDPEANVRGVAAGALAEIGSQAIEPLITSLKDPDAVVRGYAAAALVRIGSQAVEPLIAALKDQDAKVRLNAAGVLGQIKDSRSVEPLIDTLTDANADVRQNAVFALGQIKDPRSVEPLIGALTDQDARVRLNAASALGLLGDPRSVAPLIAAMTDLDPRVGAMAAGALVQIGPQAVEPLLAALKDPVVDVRILAASALGKIKDSRAVEPLIGALKDSDVQVRTTAADALRQMNDPATAETVTAALKASEVQGQKHPREPTPADSQNPQMTTNATVNRLLLFAGGADPAPIGARSYANRFPSGSTQFIYYDLEITLPAVQHARSYELKADWYGPDGKVDYEQKVKGQIFSNLIARDFQTHGFGSRASGTIAPGRYRLQLSMDGEKIAEKYFEVFQAKTTAPLTQTATIYIYSLKRRDRPSSFFVNGNQIDLQPKSGFVETTVPEGKTVVLSSGFSLPGIDGFEECKGLNLQRITVAGFSQTGEMAQLLHCLTAYDAAIGIAEASLQSSGPPGEVIEFCHLRWRDVSGQSGVPRYLYSKEDATACIEGLTVVRKTIADIDLQTGYRKSVPRAELNAEAGKTYYLSVSGIGDQNKLEIVDAATGEQAVSKLPHAN